MQNFFEGDVKESMQLQLNALPLIEQLFCEVNPIPVKKRDELDGNGSWRTSYAIDRAYRGAYGNAKKCDERFWNFIDRCEQ